MQGKLGHLVPTAVEDDRQTDAIRSTKSQISKDTTDNGTNLSGET